MRISKIILRIFLSFFKFIISYFILWNLKRFKLDINLKSMKNYLNMKFYDMN